MLASTLPHPRPFRATRCVAYRSAPNAVRWSISPFRSSVRTTTAGVVAASERGDTVSELVKVLNTGIRSCKSLQDLEDNFSANSSEYDAVCVATAWVTLANLRGQKEARQHFARHKLLSKTLATVHLKEMRSLANMLWAVGKLQVDLAQERLGPYFAESTEERIRQLVDAAGLPDGRSADQLWYGLVLSRYPWSQELLRVLVQHTVPALGTWDLKAQAQVLLHISELCPQLPGDDQREQLVAAVEQIVATWSPDEQQPYRCTWPLLGGVHGLGLRISPACKRSLSGLILNTPLNILKEVGARSMSYGLVNLLHLGCTLTPAEASRWEEMLLTAWSSAPRRADERQSHFGLLLSALLEVPNFAPSEELQQQLREVAVDSAGLDMRTARQVLLAAKAWGLVLPPEAARGLQQQATAGRRPLGAKSQPRSRSRKGS